LGGEPFVAFGGQWLELGLRGRRSLERDQIPAKFGDGPWDNQRCCRMPGTVLDLFQACSQERLVTMLLPAAGKLLSNLPTTDFAVRALLDLVCGT
jgi:hypothetical protein